MPPSGSPRRSTRPCGWRCSRPCPTPPPRSPRPSTGRPSRSACVVAIPDFVVTTPTADGADRCRTPRSVGATDGARRRRRHGPHHAAPPRGAQAARRGRRHDGPPVAQHLARRRRPRRRRRAAADVVAPRRPPGRQAALGLGPLTRPPPTQPPTTDPPGAPTMNTFTTTKPPRLVHRHEGRHRLRSRPSTATETTVDVTPLDDHDATLDALLATTVEQHGDDIVVHVPGRFSVLGRSPKLAIAVTAPHDARLAVKTGSADVVATGRFGTQRGASGSGDLTLGDFTDSLRVDSGSGDVRVESVTKDVVAKTGLRRHRHRRRRRRRLDHQRLRRHRRRRREPRPGGQDGQRQHHRRLGAARPADHDRPPATSASTSSPRARSRPRRRPATSTPACRRGPRRGSTSTPSAVGSPARLDAAAEPASDDRTVRLAAVDGQRRHRARPGSEPGSAHPRRVVTFRPS